MKVSNQNSKDGDGVFRKTLNDRRQRKDAKLQKEDDESARSRKLEKPQVREPKGSEPREWGRAPAS
jgi:hypothetical protein